jgi:hypothetical protein
MRKTTSWLTLALILALSATLPAQTAPPYFKYNLKRIDFKISQQPQPILTWTITGKKSSHLVLPVWDEGSGKYWLFQYNMKQNGKPEKLDLEVPTSELRGIVGDAVLFSSTDVPGAGAAFGDTVMLFLAQYPNTLWNTVEIKYMGFDAVGEYTIEKKDIISITPQQPQMIPLFDIAAGLGPQTMAVVFSVNYFENSLNRAGYQATEVYFAEFDFSGEQSGPLEIVPLPGNGNLRICRVGRPVYNGKGWLIPLTTSRMKVTVISGIPIAQTDGNDLFVAAVTGSSEARKMRCNKIATTGNTASLAYSNVAFLPPASQESARAKTLPDAAGQTLTLFYSERTFIPVEQRTLENFTTDYYAANVSSKGKKTGPIVIVDVPAWDHKLHYDPEKNYTITQNNSCSPPVLGEDGNYYLAQARSLRLWEGSTPHAEEHEFSIYSLDPQSGDVQVVARGSNNWSGQFTAPLLQWFSGRLAAINTFVTASGEFRHYFSRVKP